MAIRFLGKKTHKFYFQNDAEISSYVTIFGDELDVSTQAGTLKPNSIKAKYRGRDGVIVKTSNWNPDKVFLRKRSLEMYFLDVGQGDAAFVVTPNNIKILVDGGLKDRALGFLIWKYRLDKPNTKVTIDHMFLSHADADHVEGLIPLLKHPKITVKNIYHNGIAIFKSGFNEALGRVVGKKLTTVHDSIQELNGLDLTDGYENWINAVKDSGANYRRMDASDGIIDIGDNDIEVEVVGPILDTDGSLDWFSDKAHTINGHSLVFRLGYNHVRTFFSGDLNIKGGKKVLSVPGNNLKVNAHIFKAPHHGSHEFHQELFDAVNPMITVVSSGETPDHGHPRANFLGCIGKAGRGEEPLIFSTELSALFVDAGDSDSVNHANVETTTLGDLDFTRSSSNTEARLRFKKVLPGIINVRTDGDKIYAYRRVQMGYQWESYEMDFVNS